MVGIHIGAIAAVAAAQAQAVPLAPQPVHKTTYECLVTVEGLEQKMKDGLWMGMITRTGREPENSSYHRLAVNMVDFEVAVEADRVAIRNQNALCFRLPPFMPGVAVALFDSERDGDLVATINLDMIQYSNSASSAFDVQIIRIKPWQTWFTLLKTPEDAPVKSEEVAEARPVLGFNPEEVGASDAWI